MAAELEIPRALPVDHLSVSSVNAYLRCPLKWKRRYIDRDYEPPGGKMILGSSVGAAEAHAYQEQIDTGQRPPTEAVLDLFADEWEDRTQREEIAWESDKPGQLKDDGIAAVKLYDSTIAPHVTPTHVEREFNLQLEGVDWGFTGFFDVEQDDGAVADLKVRGRKLSPNDAHVDLQPTAYLLARRAEGNPAPAFRFHTMVRVKQPYAEVVPTVRSDRQLDAFVDRLYGIAAEMHWRLEHDIWQGAVPGSWWCSEKFCGYWASCPLGGAR
jgi:hypothetical protein